MIERKGDDGWYLLFLIPTEKSLKRIVDTFGVISASDREITNRAAEKKTFLASRPQFRDSAKSNFLRNDNTWHRNVEDARTRWRQKLGVKSLKDGFLDIWPAFVHLSLSKRCTLEAFRKVTQSPIPSFSLKFTTTVTTGKVGKKESYAWFMNALEALPAPLCSLVQGSGLDVQSNPHITIRKYQEFKKPAGPKSFPGQSEITIEFDRIAIALPGHLDKCRSVSLAPPRRIVPSVAISPSPSPSMSTEPGRPPSSEPTKLPSPSPSPSPSIEPTLEPEDIEDVTSLTQNLSLSSRDTRPPLGDTTTKGDPSPTPKEPPSPPLGDTLGDTTPKGDPTPHPNSELDSQLGVDCTIKPAEDTNTPPSPSPSPATLLEKGNREVDLLPHTTNQQTGNQEKATSPRRNNNRNNNNRKKKPRGRK